MKLKYGTSGFRFRVSIILSIAYKIGRAISGMEQNIGIMITASHNSHLDNGIKIVNKLIKFFFSFWPFHKSL